MEIPNKFSPNYIDGGYDSLVFHDPENPEKILKYYNHPYCFGNQRLFLRDVEEYHVIHRNYTSIGPMKGLAMHAGEICEISLSILDLGEDIFSIPESEVIVARVPKVLGHHCIIGNVFEAVRNTLAANGVPIEIPGFHHDGHRLSPRNVHYTETGENRLNIIVTDLGSSIQESLEIERRLGK